MHIDWTINVSNLLALAGGLFVAARWIVLSIREFTRRIDLHEEALLNAGWLRKDRSGRIEVVRRQHGAGV